MQVTVNKGTFWAPGVPISNSAARVEYWDKVAVVAYPDYVAGQNVLNGGMPKIGYESITNFRAGLNFTFIIGK